MQRFLQRVYNSRKIKISFKIISHTAVIISVISYVLLLYLKVRSGWMDAAKFVTVSAVPFVLVSVIRRAIDAPRPYELYDFYEVKPKGKAGSSFPSRHVFSAFMIAVLALPVSLPLSAALLAVSLSLAAARAALGIHFIRDVAAGALIGVLSGILAIIL